MKFHCLVKGNRRAAIDAAANHLPSEATVSIAGADREYGCVSLLVEAEGYELERSLTEWYLDMSYELERRAGFLPGALLLYTEARGRRPERSEGLRTTTNRPEA